MSHNRQQWLDNQTPDSVYFDGLQLTNVANYEQYAGRYDRQHLFGQEGSCRLSQCGKKLDNVEKLSFKASAMIKQLLIFARKGVVEMKPFGLTSFIREVSQLNESSVPKNITFHSQLYHDELVVKGDATQLQQVLMNLLNNARDAVENVQDPTVFLTLELMEADEHFINFHPDITGYLFAHLVVMDNGCGINVEDKEHIFEPFFTTKEVGRGTGLGLSMAYGAIQSHGGIIEVDSSLGKGTSIHIYLPRIEEEVIAKVQDERLDTVVLGKGELILLVDDNADLRCTSKKVLESLAYRVLEASDGFKAIEAFSANHQEIALVLMDVVMPRLGGVQAAVCIEETYPGTKIVFSTGYDKDETLTSEMPPDHYQVLSKPYQTAKLSQVIRAQLDLA